MQTRYNAVKKTLSNPKYAEYFKALPYNSGYFMCIKPAEGIDAEKVRLLLIEKFSIGTININGLIRIAFSAVAAKDVETMFEGIYEACKIVKG